MYKNLSPDALGIFGRQGEMLEITLTHRFKGLEIDVVDLLKRAKAASVPQACKYLASAKIAIGGYDLPIRWAGSDADFQADLAGIEPLLEIARTLSAQRAYTTVRPTSDERPFHENFQFHVERLQALADALAPAGIKVGLAFQASAADRADGGFEFIHQVDPLLLLVNAVQRANIGVLLDTWSWTVGGGDVEKVRSLKANQIIGVRLADIPAGVDLAAIQPQQRVLPHDEGQVDCVSYLSVLEEMGYDGPVTVSQHASHTKGQTRESTISKSSTLLDSLLTTAGVAGFGSLAEAK
jgi:sugar phosphate isomerase/epimerase